ncbi:SPOR domain-containing protein [Aquimarina sp. ERC-38]|uniref:SPOR domain-containing protein n=1 Tax=Aquimarina sp. ERC-38 TaxID=2949996 RepID=UPI002248490A|nr:SPOR domain-containing protein [Aquimarina sp. ERC-38]UZO81226.1 SPOR domain-containing protein [Aquimarina sp. ERC-38]
MGIQRIVITFILCLITGFNYAQNDQKESITQPNIVSFQKEPGKVTIHEDVRIKKLLSIKTDMDKKGSLSENYRIQLYYGNNNEAQKVLTKAQEEFPQWDASIIWETPNFKVWLGNYRTKLEVDRALKEVKKTFKTAFSFKPE